MARQGREVALVLLVVVACLAGSACAYNLSPRPNREIKDPQLAPVMPKVRASYFGYSLSLRPHG